jgi:hypothetical protein
MFILAAAQPSPAQMRLVDSIKRKDAAQVSRSILGSLGLKSDERDRRCASENLPEWSLL